MTRSIFHLFSQTAPSVVGHISGQPLGPWPVAIISGIFLLISVMMFFGAKQRKRKRQNLELLAGELGLQFAEKSSLPDQPGLPFPSLEGRYRNRAVRLFSYGSGFVKDKHDSMPMLVLDAAEAALATNTGFIFELNSNLAPIDGQDGSLEKLNSDDAAFGQKFTVKSNDVRRAQTLLASKIRDRLMEDSAQGLGAIQLTIRYGKIAYGKSDAFLGDGASVTAMLDFVCELAALLERNPA